MPTDISPEEVFQAIGRLRGEAEAEIERLLTFLDETEPDPDLEPYLGTGQDGGDDREAGDDGAEPSLGWTEQEARWGRHAEGYLDGEIDEGNDEPSLGSLTSHGEGDQSRWAAGGVADVEEEHDGREPDDNEGGDGAAENDEPTLGWPERVNQAANAGSQNGDDRELQNHLSVRPRRRRGKKGITVEGRGYGDRKIIRGLTDHQSAALDERMDRYGTVSLETINTRGLL